MVLVSRVAELLLLIIAVVSFMASIALSRESGSANLPALFIAILSSIGVYLLHKRIKRHTEPKPVTIPADFRGPLKVYRGKILLILLAIMAALLLIAAPFSYEHGKYGGAIFAGLFGGLALLALLSNLRNIGVPYLILDDQAITTQVYGRVPWNDVDNTSLQIIENKGAKVYVLGLSVYEPEKYFQRMGYLDRLFKMKWLELPSERNKLRISLNMLSHKPLYIDSVVKQMRAQYAQSIGIKPKTGDLSIDRNLTEIDKLMSSVNAGDNAEKLRTVNSRIEKLTHDVRQEFQDRANQVKKEILILFVVLISVIGFFIAAKLLGK